MAGNKSFEWNIDFSAFINKRVVVETREGFIRDGKMTAVKYDQMTIDGTVIDYPREIVMNNEDAIPFEQIRFLSKKA